MRHFFNRASLLARPLSFTIGMKPAPAFSQTLPFWYFTTTNNVVMAQTACGTLACQKDKKAGTFFLNGGGTEGWHKDLTQADTGYFFVMNTSIWKGDYYSLYGIEPKGTPYIIHERANEKQEEVSDTRRANITAFQALGLETSCKELFLSNFLYTTETLFNRPVGVQSKMTSGFVSVG